MIPCECTSKRWDLFLFLSREEEVEISKRIEKAQIQIERIIMRFRYSTAETISIANYLMHGKERFDKCVAEKEVPNKQEFLNLLPKLCALLKQEDDHLEHLLKQIDNPALKKNEKATLLEEIGKMPHPYSSLSAPFPCAP